MEDYLKKDYDVIEDVNYLKSESDISDYFKEDAHDYFDCGQGYYQDEADLICKIGEKFYSVKIIAEITSAKQDCGDRLYWVDFIKSVVHEEIEKPKKKTRHNASIMLLEASESEVTFVVKFLQENKIEYKLSLGV